MRRLLLVLCTALALLAAADRGAAWLLQRDVRLRNPDDARLRTFDNLVHLRFEDMHADMRGAAVRAWEAWRMVPETKPADELRVVLLGDSVGLFAVNAATVAARLRAHEPGRTVRVVPLFVPGVTLVDTLRLVPAALTRKPDVLVVLLDVPALRPEARMPADLAALFSTGGLPAVGDADGWRGRLMQVLALYRAREVARDWLRHATAAVLPDRGPHPVATSIAAIGEAAARDDVAGVRAGYERLRFHPDPVATQVRATLVAQPPLATLVTEAGAAVQAAGVRGLAVWTPVNPLFRAAARAADAPDMHVDDAALRAAADAVLTAFRQAGFATVDRVDGVPAGAFIDAVHVNGTGMAQFSDALADDVAALVAPAVAAR